MDYNAESGRPSYMEGCKQTGGILGLENRGWHTQENEQKDRDLELEDSVGVSQELLSWFRWSSMVVLDVVSELIELKEGTMGSRLRLEMSFQVL